MRVGACDGLERGDDLGLRCLACLVDKYVREVAYVHSDVVRERRVSTSRDDDPIRVQDLAFRQDEVIVSYQGVLHEVFGECDLGAEDGVAPKHLLRSQCDRESLSDEIRRAVAWRAGQDLGIWLGVQYLADALNDRDRLSCTRSVTE